MLLFLHIHTEMALLVSHLNAVNLNVLWTKFLAPLSGDLCVMSSTVVSCVFYMVRQQYFVFWVRCMSEKSGIEMHRVQFSLHHFNHLIIRHLLQDSLLCFPSLLNWNWWSESHSECAYLNCLSAILWRHSVRFMVTLQNSAYVILW